MSVQIALFAATASVVLPCSLKAWLTRSCGRDDTHTTNALRLQNVGQNPRKATQRGSVSLYACVTDCSICMCYRRRKRGSGGMETCMHNQTRMTTAIVPKV